MRFLSSVLLLVCLSFALLALSSPVNALARRPRVSSLQPVLELSGKPKAAASTSGSSSKASGKTTVKTAPTPSHSDAAPYSPPKATAAGGDSDDPAVVAKNILADNERRRNILPDGYARKLAKISGDAYSFFRGTTPQYYRRFFASLPKSLQDAPIAIVHGDLHIENFGVVPVGKTDVTYGVDDFDENLRGPVTVDLIRLLASVQVAYKPLSDGLFNDLLDGYLKAMDGVIHLKSETINKLLESSRKLRNKDLLAKRTKLVGKTRQMVVDEKGRALAPQVKPTVIASMKSGKLARKPNFQDVLHRYGGTASLDLHRFEGVAGDGDDDDMIIEMKELLNSVLAKHLPSNTANNFQRVQNGLKAWQSTPLPISTATWNNYPMLLRVRPAFKATIPPDTVPISDFRNFFEDLGKLTGKGHAATVAGGTAALTKFVTQNRKELIEFAKKMGKKSLADFEAFKPAAAAAIKATGVILPPSVTAPATKAKKK